MRNLSMKKFGTPIGAAPGMAIDVVGLSSVGRPPRPAVGRAAASAPPPAGASSARPGSASVPSRGASLAGGLLLAAALLADLRLGRRGCSGSAAGGGRRRGRLAGGRRGRWSSASWRRWPASSTTGAGFGSSAIAGSGRYSTPGYAMSHTSVSGRDVDADRDDAAVGERELERPDLGVGGQHGATEAGGRQPGEAERERGARAHQARTPVTGRREKARGGAGHCARRQRAPCIIPVSFGRYQPRRGRPRTSRSPAALERDALEHVGDGLARVDRAPRGSRRCPSSGSRPSGRCRARTARRRASRCSRSPSFSSRLISTRCGARSAPCAGARSARATCSVAPTSTSASCDRLLHRRLDAVERRASRRSARRSRRCRRARWRARGRRRRRTARAGAVAPLRRWMMSCVDAVALAARTGTARGRGRRAPGSRGAGRAAAGSRAARCARTPRPGRGARRRRSRPDASPRSEP